MMDRYNRFREVAGNTKPRVFDVFVAIGRNWPTTAKEVCGKCEFSKVAFSRDIKKLIDLGLLESERYQNDHRVSILSLTDKGRKVFGEED